MFCAKGLVSFPNRVKRGGEETFIHLKNIKFLCFMRKRGRGSFCQIFFKIRHTFFFLAFLFFLTSCGLDSYYYLSPPLNDGHTAENNYTSVDEIQNYFSFLTNETSSVGNNADYLASSSEFVFLGTEVYYKIYSSYSTMTSVESRISTLNSSTTSYTAAAEALLTTYNYHPLKLSSGALTPLIQAKGQNQYVYIRLDDYKYDSEPYSYRAAICVSTDGRLSSFSESDALTHNGEIIYPRRYINSDYTFNFGGSNSSVDKVPTSSDADVNYSSVSESGSWYVDMYAVSVGRDTSYSYSYSRVLFLGSVKISEGS